MASLWTGPLRPTAVHRFSTARPPAVDTQHPTGPPVEPRTRLRYVLRVTIFHLRQAYHDSLSNMRGWLLDSSVSGQLTALDRLSIIDAWQQEMIEYFNKNGYCFSCNKRLPRCACPEEEH